MKPGNSSSFVTHLTFVAVVACVIATTPLAAQEAPRTLCFLDSFEAEMEEDSAMNHAVEMGVACAHADRAVLGVAEFDLRFLDGDADLIEAGVAWMQAYEEAGGTGYFSSQGTNTIEVSQVGRERWVELRAHSHAIPDSGIATLEGTVDLVIEADCTGNDAVEPVVVETTAGALRSGASIALTDGGEIVAIEQGSSNETPMLAISGDGSYFAMPEPPAGVREHIFFGKKRVLVEADAVDEAAVTLLICPSEVVRVPVSIEASI